MKKLLFLSIGLLCCLFTVQAQKSSKIKIEYSDFSDINQEEIPDALLLRGNVRVSHEGVVFTCNKAY
ncbi:MAG: OstA-like protein, partial [Flavobacterium macrobrachii]